MDVFNLEKIIELEIDVFNQYLYMYDFIVRYDEWMSNSDVKVDLYTENLKNLSEKHLSILFKVIKLEPNEEFFSELAKFKNKDLLEIFSNLKVKFPEDCPKVKKEFGSTYTNEDYIEIYNDMQLRKNDKEYMQKAYIHNCSIQSLIDILDMLKILKNKLNEIDLKTANFEYNRILQKYAVMNHADYGVGNIKLKRKIDKMRSLKGEYQQLILTKNNIFISILQDNFKSHGKWKNPTEAIKANINEINKHFKEFDCEWVNRKIVENSIEIEKLGSLIEACETSDKLKNKSKIELNKLIQFNEKLEKSLIDGYPFYHLKNILPYNTDDLEIILVKSLRKRVDVIDDLILLI